MVLKIQKMNQSENTKILVEFPDNINLLIIEKQMQIKKLTGKKVKKPFAVVALIEDLIKK